MAKGANPPIRVVPDHDSFLRDSTEHDRLRHRRRGTPTSDTATSAMTYVGIYLNDHRAAATGGLRLAQRCRDSNEATELGAFLDGFVDELHRDETLLSAIGDAADVRSNPIKQTMAIVGELMARCKLNGHLGSYSPLSRVLELEGLIAGVNAKRRLWVALQHVLDAGNGPVDERLAASADRWRTEIADAERRANRQLELLERFHAEAVHVAFVASGDAG